MHGGPDGGWQLTHGGPDEGRAQLLHNAGAMRARLYPPLPRLTERRTRTTRDTVQT